MTPLTYTLLVAASAIVVAIGAGLLALVGLRLIGAL